jgi:ankyrin repeat protein
MPAMTPSQVNYGHDSGVIARRRPRFLGLSFVLMLVIVLGLGGYIGFRGWHIFRINSLFSAAGKGDAATVERLLKSGLSPNQKDTRGGQTILMYAAQIGQAEVVRTLLKHGANPNLKFKGRGGEYFEGRTALMYAVEATTSFPPVVSFPGGNQSSVLQLLVEAGAELNPHDRWGQTPLAIAIDRSQAAAAAYLLERGANPNVTNMFGEPGLIVAIETSQIPTALLLIEKGADVNATDGSGQGKKPSPMGRPAGRSTPGDTPLMTAVKAKKAEVIRALLSRGAQPDATNSTGATVWTLTDDPELLRLLKAVEK